MANDKILHVDENTFETNVITSEVPVVVDFWAVWCGPCKAIAPMLDDAANDYDGRLRIAKVDTDKNARLAIKYGVQSIPTLLVVKGGEVVAKHVGALNRAAFDKLISPVL